MKHMYVIEMKKIKQYGLICFTALFTAIFFYVQNHPHSVFTLNSNPLNKAIYQIEGTDKKAALTFDISWGDEKALPIIKELESLHIKKATFFLSASWAERHPEIVNKIDKAGFEIGSLGYNYTPYTKLTNVEVQKDIAKSLEVFTKLGIENIELLRPPSGYINEEVLKIATQYNLTIIQWSKDSKDWLTPGTNEIILNATRDKENGDIILLHASDSATQTKDALHGIKSSWEKEGYSFSTVGELLSNTKAESKEIN